jgi:hypothetical protein
LSDAQLQAAAKHYKQLHTLHSLRDDPDDPIAVALMSASVSSSSMWQTTTPPPGGGGGGGGGAAAKKLTDSSDLKLEFCDECDIYLGGLFPVHAPKYVRNKRKSTTTTVEPPPPPPQPSTSTVRETLVNLNSEIDNDYVIYHRTSDALASAETSTATTRLSSSTTPVDGGAPVPSTTVGFNFDTIDDFQDNLFYLNDINCGEVKKERGIQRLEAMLYAIDLINNDSELLPNLRLGARIYDTCDRDTIALEKCINFVSDYFVLNDENIVNDFTCVPTPTASWSSQTSAGLNPKNSFMIPQKNVNAIHKRKVIGVIGAASSSVSIQVANLLRLFQVNFHLFFANKFF